MNNYIRNPVRRSGLGLLGGDLNYIWRTNMSKLIDMTGTECGRLTVIERTGSTKSGDALWRCVCKCGRETIVTGNRLRRGRTKSCGCLRADQAARSYNDIGNTRFGRLLVIRRYGSNKYGNATWLCACDCGASCITTASSLLSGDTRSCGCLNRELIRARNQNRITHGDSKKRLYRVWQEMIQRCYNPNATAFREYGGRGISVCDEWRNYESFRDWAIGAGYDENAPHGVCTLDRIRVNGRYEPENCRWVSMGEQSLNKRSTLRMEYDERLYTTSELSSITGLSSSTLRRRWHAGDRNQDLVRPLRQRKQSKHIASMSAA